MKLHLKKISMKKLGKKNGTTMAGIITDGTRIKLTITLILLVEKERRKESICEYICNLNNKGSVISSTRSLQSKLKEKKDMELKRNYLAQILRENVGMRYKKIKPITVNTNSEKNLVLR